MGPFRPWEANWFAPEKDYTKLLHEDLDMRRLILSRLRNAGIARIETERSSNAQMTVTIHTAKPGIVIGKGGASVDQLREDLEKRFGNRVRISIQEIKQPELDAQLVAENIASQIERRISHRRAMKQSILRTMRAGAKGVRIAMAGRLRGGEMARRESDRDFNDRVDLVQEFDATGCAPIDWDRTLAFRRHLWRNGFAVAEAMDTAQRGGGLSWPSAKELIARASADSRDTGGRIAADIVS